MAKCVVVLELMDDGEVRLRRTILAGRSATIVEVETNGRRTFCNADYDGEPPMPDAEALRRLGPIFLPKQR